MPLMNNLLLQTVPYPPPVSPEQLTLPFSMGSTPTPQVVVIPTQMSLPFAPGEWAGVRQLQLPLEFKTGPRILLPAEQRAYPLGRPIYQRPGPLIDPTKTNAQLILPTKNLPPPSAELTARFAKTPQTLYSPSGSVLTKGPVPEQLQMNLQIQPTQLRLPFTGETIRVGPTTPAASVSSAEQLNLFDNIAGQAAAGQTAGQTAGQAASQATKQAATEAAETAVGTAAKSLSDLPPPPVATTTTATAANPGLFARARGALPTARGVIARPTTRGVIARGFTYPMVANLIGGMLGDKSPYRPEARQSPIGRVLRSTIAVGTVGGVAGGPVGAILGGLGGAAGQIGMELAGQIGEHTGFTDTARKYQADLEERKKKGGLEGVAATVEDWDPKTWLPRTLANWGTNPPDMGNVLAEIPILGDLFGWGEENKLSGDGQSQASGQQATDQYRQAQQQVFKQLNRDMFAEDLKLIGLSDEDYQRILSKYDTTTRMIDRQKEAGLLTIPIPVAEQNGKLYANGVELKQDKGTWKLGGQTVQVTTNQDGSKVIEVPADDFVADQIRAQVYLDLLSYASDYKTQLDATQQAAQQELARLLGISTALTAATKPYTDSIQQTTDAFANYAAQFPYAAPLAEAFRTSEGLANQSYAASFAAAPYLQYLQQKNIEAQAAAAYDQELAKAQLELQRQLALEDYRRQYGHSSYQIDPMAQLLAGNLKNENNK